ncbi:hypothetical protein KW795_01020 [Candidatus Microgenomates bacterium]|nr:hypothetical protein [Candidatus Microgenomates bacterium]
MNNDTETKLVLIDGNAVMHRAFHALPNLTTTLGEPINAVYGFISMLLRIIQDIKPTHIAVCFDRAEPTFRKKEFEKYQSKRPEMDAQLSSQFAKMQDTLRAIGIPVYDKAGFEADDLIGTISKLAKVNKVIIVTGDKDILQLVDDKTKVYMPTKGMSEGKLYGDIEVKEKLGVTPKQIIDLKALIGDSSDNYPGVPGIGPKTATKLIEDYNNLENIYSHLNDIKEAIKNKLVNGRESGFLCKKLATIVRDVDVDFDLKDSGKWKIDNPDVIDLFADFGFRTLTKRVQEVGKLVQSENQMTLL